METGYAWYAVSVSCSNEQFLSLLILNLVVTLKCRSRHCLSPHYSLCPYSMPTQCCILPPGGNCHHHSTLSENMDPEWKWLVEVKLIKQSSTAGISLIVWLQAVVIDCSRIHSAGCSVSKWLLLCVDNRARDPLLAKYFWWCSHIFLARSSKLTPPI